MSYLILLKFGNFMPTASTSTPAPTPRLTRRNSESNLTKDTWAKPRLRRTESMPNMKIDKVATEAELAAHARYKKTYTEITKEHTLEVLKLIWKKEDEDFQKHYLSESIVTD